MFQYIMKNLESKSIFAANFSQKLRKSIDLPRWRDMLMAEGKQR